MIHDTILWQRLTGLYPESEAKAIVRWMLDVRFGLSLTDIVCGCLAQLSPAENSELETIMRRLEQGEPVQYVVGTAYFCGRPFHVEPGVLIPRPETEELCQWVIADAAENIPRTILDVGTGSGCIAITLALSIPQSGVVAWDVSDVALRIARDNASALGADITFERCNALDPQLSTVHRPLSTINTIISNPPYICHNERAAMARNVLAYEPDEALFVPDADPLLFYRAIARYAAEALTTGGRLYFELNPLYAEDTVTMLSGFGFSHIEIRQDAFGKQRLLQARKI